MTCLASGAWGAPTTAVADLTGREPHAFQDCLADHLAAFRRQQRRRRRRVAGLQRRAGSAVAGIDEARWTVALSNRLGSYSEAVRRRSNLRCRPREQDKPSGAYPFAIPAAVDKSDALTGHEGGRWPPTLTNEK
ncbi:hypothetical protein Pa4123_41370 [Phytohabitans aurantiacus]|uniref:Uncharacterized protein n=1 Tax=Phytohabitans aurantiacus TaxID=3016789 RepID=A0ABQ5QY56_9ACTN|nr:hypothetical protein Pa4123_41370 [Phytohabitans aurantiacus]